MRKIIDSHAHLGDIFHPMKNVTFKQNVKTFDFGTYRNIFIEHEDNNYEGPLFDENNMADYHNLINAGQLLSWENTLENVSRRLDESDINYVVMLPILPGNSFEEMLAASKLDPRILAFTSADYNLPLDEMEAKLRLDVKNGARGLKLHAVIQNIRLTDPRLRRAVEVFSSLGLPIISHCGANDYYLPDVTYPRDPEAGDSKYFIQLANEYPDAKLVAAHGGGSFAGDMERLAAATKGLKNIYTDTSFRSADEVLQAIELFGEDKVMFATDNPFGTYPGSLRQVDKALKDEPVLLDKVLYQNAATLLNILA
jgi:predicted TIM-barrel fold metal-dependent hydrolase